MYIDIYTHIFPADFYKRMGEIAPSLGNIGKRMQSVAAVHDLDVRFRAMDQFGDYRQIISLPNPPLEDYTTPEHGIELGIPVKRSSSPSVSASPIRRLPWLGIPMMSPA